MDKPEIFLAESKVCDLNRTIVGPRLSWNGFGVLNRNLWFTCRSRDGQTVFSRYLSTLASSSTNFCSRSLWFNPNCFSMT